MKNLHQKDFKVKVWSGMNAHSFNTRLLFVQQLLLLASHLILHKDTTRSRSPRSRARAVTQNKCLQEKHGRGEASLLFHTHACTHTCACVQPARYADKQKRATHTGRAAPAAGHVLQRHRACSKVTGVAKRLHIGARELPVLLLPLQLQTISTRAARSHGRA